MDLIEFRRALRRHLRVALVAAIAVLSVGLVGLRSSPVNYTATSTVLVTPRAERFDVASATVLRVILPNVALIAKSESLRADAAPHVPKAYSKSRVVIDATFATDASTLLVSARSRDAAAAIAWSVAEARALTDRMKDDKYVAVQSLDFAETAALTGARVRLLGVASAVGLAFVAFVLTAFGAQRLEESRDITGALRKRGVRVLGSVIPGRRRRLDDELAAIRGALAPDDENDARLVVAALTDKSLAHWLAAGLDEGRGESGVWEPPCAEPLVAPAGASGRAPGADPFFPEVPVEAALRDHQSVVLVADDRVSSVAEITEGVESLRRSGVACRGVVLVRGGPGLRRALYRERRRAR